MKTEKPITATLANAGLDSYDIDSLLDAYIVLQKSTQGGEVIVFTFQEAKDRIRSELEKRNPKDLVSYMINDAM